MAELRLGTEQSTTNSLQLWKSSVPSEKCAQVLGITSQARPADRNHSLMELRCLILIVPAEEVPAFPQKFRSLNRCV